MNVYRERCVLPPDKREPQLMGFSSTNVGGVFFLFFVYGDGCVYPYLQRNRREEDCGRRLRVQRGGIDNRGKKFFFSVRHTSSRKWAFFIFVRGGFGKKTLF